MLLLIPLSILYRMAAGLRHLAYRKGLLRSRQLPVPVIVVGNITAGGTGKTPLVIQLVSLLRYAGYSPGVVLRGYGGVVSNRPKTVIADSDPGQVGDEAVLIAGRCNCPVAVGRDRVAAARLLLDHTETVNVIVSDDGLQHYAMQRDLEIAVIDGERRFGNGLHLPAGPLRESPSRLKEVDMVVVNGGRPNQGEYLMSFALKQVCCLAEPSRCLPLESFVGLAVHAAAGIGNPEQFFHMLTEAGLDIREHPFPDHHPFKVGDLDFPGEDPVLITEKDAVKYREFAKPRHWYLPVETHLSEAFNYQLLEMLHEKTGPSVPARPA
jgi:tetraacyldisaccharide 4'-kinase